MNNDSPIAPELLEQTRQRIRELLERTARLAREERSRLDFFQEFLHLTMDGLDARGGAIWVRSAEGPLEIATQRHFPFAQLPKGTPETRKHQRLLDLVLVQGEAAVILPDAGVSHTGEQVARTAEQMAGGVPQGEMSGVTRWGPDRAAAGQSPFPVQVNESGNPTDALLLLAPLRNHERSIGLIELFLPNSTPASAQHGYLRLLVQLCDLASDFLNADTLREARDKQVLWSVLNEFTRTVHAALDVTGTAYALANDGRRLIGADRVTVLLRRGRRCRVEAISGQDVFDRRSRTVRLLSQLTETVLRSDEPLWFSGDTENLPPQIEQALQAYVDQSESRTIGILPLRRASMATKGATDSEREAREAASPAAFGAIVVEQIDERRPRPGLVERSELVSTHGALALANALEYGNLFLLPLWRFLGRVRAALAPRKLPRIATATILLGGVIAALGLVPAEFTLEGRGTLEPVRQQNVFAGAAGIIERVNVEHGSRVEPQAVLAEMRNSDLDFDLTTLQGQRAATLERYNAVKIAALDGKKLTDVERDRLHGEEEQLQKELASLDHQIGVVQRKLERMRVLSPMAGEVITWDVRELLIERPVERGQILLTLADPAGPWRLELRMAEERMGHIVRAQKEIGSELPVDFILATNPHVTYHGTVQTIHDRAEVYREEGNQVLIKVAIDKDQLPSLRPGATVLAKIHCGRRAVGYVWFHEVIEFVQSRILFRL